MRKAGIEVHGLRTRIDAFTGRMALFDVGEAAKFNTARSTSPR